MSDGNGYDSVEHTTTSRDPMATRQFQGTGRICKKNTSTQRDFLKIEIDIDK